MTQPLHERPLRCRFTADVFRGTRRVPVAGFTKFLIFYQSRDGEILILRVVHGAREPLTAESFKDAKEESGDLTSALEAQAKGLTVAEAEAVGELERKTKRLPYRVNRVTLGLGIN